MRILVTLFCAVLLALAPALASAGDKVPRHKVIFQVSDNDPARWNLVLNNVRNLQQEFGKDNVTIEVVAYGPGIHMLKFDSEVGHRLQEAADSGARVVACANTLRGMKLTMGDMHPAVGQVPAGIAELVLKQEQGYVYIRP